MNIPTFYNYIIIVRFHSGNELKDWNWKDNSNKPKWNIKDIRSKWTDIETILTKEKLRFKNLFYISMIEAKKEKI